MRNRRLAWGLAVLMLGALGLGWWMGRPGSPIAQDDRAPAPEPPAESAASPNSLGRSPNRGKPSPQNATLPPADMPLPALVALLQPRADAGDGLAACRLGVELLRCDANDYAVRFHERHRTGFVREEEAKGQLALANFIEEQQLRQLELQIQCQQLSRDVRDRGGAYLIQAARAGEPEAMLRYAVGEHWGMNLDDFLADDRFDAWRRDVPAMLQRALEAGDPRVPYLLMDAYYHDLFPHTGLIANDPVRGLAFQTLHFRLTNRPAPNSRLDTADVARAEALAAEMHRRHYGNRRLESAEQAFLPNLFSAGGDGRDPQFCQRDQE